ncbi:MAG: hypothetical protein JNM56_03445 [Planctomycetia bacterium]|nr:hypothetical protein [Planctomycetia bacterium]
MLDRLISAVVALILGFLVWLYARSRDQEMLDNAPIPVSIVLAPHQADHYDLETTGLSQITASFSGPPSRMRELRGQLQRGELRVNKMLTVPEDRLGENRFLDTVRIGVEELHPPPGVRAVVTEERNRIPVTLRRLVERRFPIRLDYTPDEPIAQLTVEPASVLVRGPADILDRLRALPTQPYVAPPRPDGGLLREFTTGGPAALVDELEGRPIRTNPASVQVRITMQPRQRLYELIDVPVQFLCPANFPLRPRWEDERAGKVTVRLLGPAGEEQPAVTAFVDLTGRKFEPGLYADEPLRLQLPKDFQLTESPPRSATFRLAPIPAERGETPNLGGARGP